MNAQQFREKLVQIGYPDARKLSLNAFSYLLEDEELAPFFEFFNLIDESNILSPEEIMRYEELEASGVKILELNELELAKIGSKEVEVPIEDLRDEVMQLSVELADLEQEKVLQECLNEIISKKNISKNTCFDLVKIESKEAEKEHKRTLTGCQVANKEINKVFEECKLPLATIEDIAEMATAATPNSLYLAFMPLEDFHKTYKEYNILLRDYIIKQFHSQIMNIAELGSEANYKLISLKGPPIENQSVEQVKMYKNLKMRHDSYCKVINQLVMASATENGVKKQIKAGEELLNLLIKGAFPHVTMLSPQLEANKADEAKFKADLDDMKDNVIPKLVSSLADVNASSIITGNYELKWKRQNYVTSKMDQVISWLAEHQSQAEFYSLCLTNEYGIVKQLHQFLQFIEVISTEKLEGYKSRMAAMEQLSLVTKYEEKDNCPLVENVEQIMQSYDDSRGGKKILSRVQRLLDKVESMKENMVTGRKEAKGNFFEETRRLEEINSCLTSLKEAVWADRPTKIGPPHFGPKELDDFTEKLEAKLKSLECDFLAARLMLQEKQQMLKHNCNLEKLRTGYLDFYNKIVA